MERATLASDLSLLSIIESPSTQTTETTLKIQKKSAPIFHSFSLIQDGEIEISPKYDWIHFDTTSLALDDAALIARESLLKELYAKQKKYSRATKENIDAAFTYIAKQDYMGWDYTINLCSERAEVTIEHLLTLGFQKECLFKVVLMGPNLGIPLNEYPWRYHIAAGVQLEDGSQYVIDPSLDTKRPLTLEQWECLSIRDAEKALTSPPLITDRRNQAITFQELDLLEAEDRHTMIVIPFNFTCESRDFEDPLAIFPISMEYSVSSYLQITEISKCCF